MDGPEARRDLETGQIAVKLTVDGRTEWFSPRAGGGQAWLAHVSADVIDGWVPLVEAGPADGQ